MFRQIRGANGRRKLIVVCAVPATAGIVIFVLAMPGIAIPALLITLTAVATIFVPEILLAAAVVLGLAGGNFAAYSSIGYGIALVGGTVSLLGLIASRGALTLLPRALLPITLLTLLAVRFAFEQDSGTVMVIIRCGAVVLLTWFAVSRKRDIVRAMAIGGATFAIISLLMGEYDPGGTRYMGLSGNPNRLVFGLLTLLPFLLSYLWRFTSTIIRVASIAFIGLNAYLLIESGSNQAIVGLAVIVTGLTMYLNSRAGPLTQGIMAVYVALFIVVILASLQLERYLTEDTLSLSGRTQMFAAALHEFLDNPLFGNGQRHVREGLVVDSSAHSSLLGLLATGGLLVGAPWILILLQLFIRGFLLLTRSSILGLAPLLLITDQLVQSVEYILVTWFIVAFFGLHYTSRETDSKHGTRPSAGRSARFSTN